MNLIYVWGLVCALAPAFLMAAMFVLTKWTACPLKHLKKRFQMASLLALMSIVFSLCLGEHRAYYPGLFITTPVILIMAFLVQSLGLVIQKFSARYLDREVGERAYLANLSAVFASVQLLLIGRPLGALDSDLGVHWGAFTIFAVFLPRSTLCARCCSQKMDDRSIG
jgi:NAD(P)H-quinone oxidoreductase subunit 5